METNKCTIKVCSTSISKKNTNNGITLIALVVTVVVILILSSITISTIGGNGGIIDTAQNSKNQTEELQNSIIDQIGELSNQLANSVSDGDNTETIILNKKIETINIDETIKLNAINLPEDETLTWKSSNEAIATVDESGTVTGIKPGNADIIATSTDGKFGTCNLTVIVDTSVIPEG